jgi:outer membrane receptor protein involved in Fe transport
VTLGGAYDLRLGANLNYSDSYYTAPEQGPTSLQDSYVTVDASVRFGRADGLWEVALVGRNLTDEYVAVDGVDDGEVTPGVPSDTQLFIQRPRQILLQFTVRPGANR